MAENPEISSQDVHGSPNGSNIATELGPTSAQQNGEDKVSGWRVLAALGLGLAAGAGVGAITYYGIPFLAPATTPTVLTQVIVVEVYALLTVAMFVAFRPVRHGPLGLGFTSVRDLGQALFAWLGVVVISATVYFVLNPVFGNVFDSLEKILSLATDVKRLQGRPTLGWAIAIPRGCLLVPLFEELFFRGAVLQWLRRHFSDLRAIVVAAALFAVMQAYPIVMPYAFVFGVVTGWIRVRTGSTLNTVSMHVLDNLASLGLGLLLLR